MRQLRAGIVITGVVSALLVGCAREALPTPPPMTDVAASIAELYRLVLGDAEVTKTEIMGKHYRSGNNAWKVVSCVEIATAGDKPASDCNDSFELYRLDGGSWMVSGTINGEYRWLQMP